MVLKFYYIYIHIYINKFNINQNIKLIKKNNGYCLWKILRYNIMRKKHPLPIYIVEWLGPSRLFARMKLSTTTIVGERRKNLARLWKRVICCIWIFATVIKLLGLLGVNRSRSRFIPFIPTWIHTPFFDFPMEYFILVTYI